MKHRESERALIPRAALVWLFRPTQQPTVISVSPPLLMHIASQALHLLHEQECSRVESDFLHWWCKVNRLAGL